MAKLKKESIVCLFKRKIDWFIITLCEYWTKIEKIKMNKNYFCDEPQYLKNDNFFGILMQLHISWFTIILMISLEAGKSKDENVE